MPAGSLLTVLCPTIRTVRTGIGAKATVRVMSAFKVTVGHPPFSSQPSLGVHVNVTVVPLEYNSVESLGASIPAGALVTPP